MADLTMLRDPDVHLRAHQEVEKRLQAIEAIMRRVAEEAQEKPKKPKAKKGKA